MAFSGQTLGERKDTAQLLSLLERIAKALETLAAPIKPPQRGPADKFGEPADKLAAEFKDELDKKLNESLKKK